MIAVGILHQSSWPWIVLAWTTGFLLLAIGLIASLVITVALRPGQGHPLPRTLFAFGPAAFAPALLFTLVRIAEQIEPSIGPGPQHWLIGWLPGKANAFVHPYDTLVALHLIACAGGAVVAVCVALVAPPRPGSRTSPLPGRWGATALLATGALLVPFFAWRVYVADADSARLLDLLGLLPAFATCVALRAHAYLPRPARKRIAAASAAPEPDAPDVRAAWIAAGLLSADAQPLERVNARDAGPQTSPRAASAWTAVDAPGLPPEALDELLGLLPTSDDLFVLGDVPSDAEHALLAAIFVDLIGVGGERILLIHPRPQAVVDGFRAALTRARTWEAGGAVVGADALQEALAGHQLPALVAVSPDDFAGRLIALADRDARRWVRGLDLIVVHRPDLGTPIEVTHAAFAFRRWHLTTQRIVRPPVLVTVPGTSAHRSFAERLFPGRDAHTVQYGARTTGVSVAWPGEDPEPDAPLPWLARAAKAAIPSAGDVDAIDPSGRWSRDAMPRGARLLREPAWSAHASVADFSPGDLVEAAGSIGNRLPSPPVHASLWSLPRDPVSRFLHPERIAALKRAGRLPRPAPVVGTRNRFLRLAHLDVALREARNDERSLRTAFGDDLVDFRLRTASEPATRASAHTSWRERGEVLRSPQLRGSAGGVRAPRSTTVTNDVVDVIEERTGAVLMQVDARTAPTRLYPKRVFAIGTRQYVVPMHAFDARRGKLTVRLAGDRDRVTRPVMSFELELRRTTVERVSQRRGSFTMHTLSAECLVTERVHAAWVPGLDVEERFDVVSSSFDSELRFVFPERARKGPGLFHLAALLEDLLPVFLRCDASDIAVTPVRAGLLPDQGAGVAVVDRFVGGMGFASALDNGTISELLTWCRALLYECACMDGCAKCSPPQVMRVGGAKQQVLEMLEGL